MTFAISLIRFKVYFNCQITGQHDKTVYLFNDVIYLFAQSAEICFKRKSENVFRYIPPNMRTVVFALTLALVGKSKLLLLDDNLLQ